MGGATSTRSAPMSGNASPTPASSARTISTGNPSGAGAPVDGASAASVPSMSFEK